MENQNHIPSETSQNAPSRVELEQHLRARAWKDDAFRQEFLTNPKAVLERDYAQYFSEGKIPSELSINVIEEEEQTICFILPSRLSDDQISDLKSLDEEELSEVGGMSGSVFCVPKTITCKCTPSCKDLVRSFRL